MVVLRFEASDQHFDTIGGNRRWYLKTFRVLAQNEIMKRPTPPTMRQLPVSAVNLSVCRFMTESGFQTHAFDCAERDLLLQYRDTSDQVPTLAC